MNLYTRLESLEDKSEGNRRKSCINLRFVVVVKPYLVVTSDLECRDARPSTNLNTDLLIYMLSKISSDDWHVYLDVIVV
jgi:hypothetical protein